MTDKPIAIKDLSPSKDEVMDAIFGKVKLEPCNEHRINLLRSAANWFETRSKTVWARDVHEGLMLAYAKDLREIADMIEKIQNA